MRALTTELRNRAHVKQAREPPTPIHELLWRAGPGELNCHERGPEEYKPIDTCFLDVPLPIRLPTCYKYPAIFPIFRRYFENTIVFASIQPS